MGLENMNVYLLPGLGFDHRIFSRLSLPERSLIYRDWMLPERGEMLSAYARRFAARIPDGEKIVLIGHSFGGILCQEIAALKKVQKIILISSIQSRAELPLHFKVIAPLRLEKLFTRQLTLHTLRFWGEQHDYAKGEQQDLVRSMIAGQENLYLQWALRNLSRWDTSPLPPDTRIVHIHGTADKTLPFRLLQQVTHPIEGGGHFMVYKRAEEISALIRRELEHA